ncbi:MAG TPA: lysine--tRNA ligase [Candidatus Moranbacteria bacterium]|nr:lysine--tRNA ligase [Candidatus Moranbacteria bacterium]
MLNQIRQDRIKKLENFKNAGIDPYPAGPFEKENITEVLQKSVGDSVKVAGRIMLLRVMGNIAFLTLQDESGRGQVVLNKKELTEDENYKLWTKNLDIGDFIGVEGERFDTQKGEKSVLARKLTLLSKSIHPLPDKHKTLQNEDEKLRKRYLDIIFNPEVKEMIYKRDLFWNSTRKFLKERGFVEVETPVLEVTAGGGDANPFVTHHNALDLDVYLRISMGELWQKRLMVAGLEKTFEIGRQFRNEGMDAEHLQDYTQMEFYWAYANYTEGMEMVKELYRFVAQETFGTTKFKIKDFEVDLAGEWKEYDYAQTIKEMTGVDIFDTSLEAILKKLDELGVKYKEDGFNLNRAIDSLWKYCRKSIGGPGFLVNEPVSMSPLAKRSTTNPELTERFHVLIAGSELGNGYSELNDPIDQAERFQKQQALRDAGDDEAQMHDRDFVEALEYGMPPTCGFGMSERVFSFFMNKTMRECQIFPLMKPKGNND